MITADVLDQVDLSTLTPEEQNELLTLVTKYDEVETLDESRNSHLKFIDHCWVKNKKTDPFVVGYHTKKVCDRIDKAIVDYHNGKSTFLRIAVHQRSGKSDIVSRYLPAHFVAANPDSEVMQVSYNANLSVKMAKFGRGLFKNEAFKELYPDARLSPSSSAAGDWMIQRREAGTDDWEDSQGRVYASGLGAGLTGNGFHLGILDDYCSSRGDAESPTYRESSWAAFTDDFMTRRAPVAIVIILATWWHEDDIHGRIARKNDPKDEEYYDPDFPEFEVMSFPARREDAEHPEEYHGEYLFPERFDEGWYKATYATLGPYSSSAMMDCNPTPRTGGLFDISGVQFHSHISAFPKNLKWFRIWDYAHTAKQRTGHDPDFTGGTLMAYEPLGYNQYIKQMEYAIWIRDYQQFRLAATERDDKIRGITHKDGPKVKVAVENSLDSTDGADYLKSQLLGIRVVSTVNCPGDKVTRCTPIEPIFSAGRVHVLRGTWNRVWLEGVKRFDGSGKTHDEMVDNLTAGYVYSKKGGGYSPLKVGVV